MRPPAHRWDDRPVKVVVLSGGTGLIGGKAVQSLHSEENQHVDNRRGNDSPSFP